ncbi:MULTISPECIES: HK97 family phage prohead protease [unclassified Nonomuraea]|uniref:HK97 family phage prohead protease n=1 Tax=unclassified Nonomuraea TaxID=2593643 RepID=UPI0033D8D343
MDLAERAKIKGPERRAFAARFEIRAKPNGTGGTRYDIEGYASVYGAPYEMWDWAGAYDEVVREGAGSKSLSENPDVVLVLNHEGMPLARTKNGSLRLSEDSTGLLMNAPDLNGERAVVREVVAAIEEEILTEMSFAFRVMRQEWSPDYMQRDIVEYNINRGDVSVVTFGANPATSVALRGLDLDRMADDQARVLFERLSARLAPPRPAPEPAAVEKAPEPETRRPRYPLSLYEAEAQLLG